MDAVGYGFDSAAADDAFTFGRTCTENRPRTLDRTGFPRRHCPRQVFCRPDRLCNGHCHCLCLCHPAELLRHGCMVNCFFQFYCSLPHGSGVHGNHPVFVCIHSKPVHRLCFGHCFSGCPLYDRLPEWNSFQQCRFSFQQKHCPQHPCGLARQCDGIGFILQPHL